MSMMGLKRAKRDRWIMGVCGSIAHRYGWNSTVVRLVTIILANVIPGVSVIPTLLIYFLLGYLLPETDEFRAPPGAFRFHPPQRITTASATWRVPLLNGLRLLQVAACPSGKPRKTAVIQREKHYPLPYRSRWMICALDRRGNSLGPSAQ